MGNQAHGKPQEAVELAHPFGVAAGQVVIDRDHVHPLPRQGVQVHRQGRHQGLALAGTHLGNAAFVEAHAADELHIEMAHAQHPAGSLPGHGKGLRQKVVQGLPCSQPLLEFLREAYQLVIGEILHLGLQSVDFLHRFTIAGYLFIIIVT